MASARLLRVLICLQILSLARAAPAIRPVASNSISLVSPSRNTTDFRFTAFPPLLPDPYTYHVQGHFFEYDIIFSRTSVYLGMNATQIEICMQKAIAMATTRASRDPTSPFPQIPVKIYSGSAPGDVEFQIHDQMPYHRITWGQWAEVLTGIDGFTKAYPGRGFLFQVQDALGIPLYGAMHGIN